GDPTADLDGDENRGDQAEPDPPRVAQHAPPERVRGLRLDRAPALRPPLPLPPPAIQLGINVHDRPSSTAFNLCRARFKRTPTLLSLMPTTSAISLYSMPSRNRMSTSR